MAYDGEIRINTKLDNSQLNSDLASLATNIGKTLSSTNLALAGVTAGIMNVAKSSVGLGLDFDAQMSKVGAISGATAEDMAALTDKAREMGAATKYTATEAAEAMESLARAGLNSNEVMSSLGGVMMAAAADGIALATSADIITNSLAAFGQGADQAGHFADVLATTSAKSNTNITMLGDSLSYAAPVAGAYGFAIEDVAVSLGAMANVGIKASSSGTAFRQILMGLQGGAEVTSKAFGEMTISMENADGTMKTWEETTLELRDAFGQMTEAEKAMNAESIAGKIGMSGLLAIVNQSEEGYNTLATAINNADGAAASMADTMQQNLAGQLKILESGMQEIGLSVSGVLTPALSAGVGVIQNLVDGFNGLPGPAKEFIVQAGAITGVLGGAYLAIQTVTAANEIYVALKAKMALAEGADTLAKSINTTATLVNAGAVQTLTAAMLASPLFYVAAGVLAISGVISYVNHLNNAYDDQVKKLNEAKQAYEAQEAVLSGLETELANVVSRIEELEAKKAAGTLTGIESDELEMLRQTNVELEKTVAHQRELTAETLETANAEAILALNARQTYEVRGQTRRLSLADVIEEDIKSYNRLQISLEQTIAQQERYREAGNEAAATGLDASIEKITARMGGLQTRISQTKSELLSHKDSLDENDESAAALIEKIEALEQAIAVLGVDTSAAAMGFADFDRAGKETSNTISSLSISSEAAAKAQEELAKAAQDAADAFKQTGQDAETLTEIQKKLEESGRIDTSSLEKILDLYPEAIVYADDFAAMQEFLAVKFAEVENASFSAFSNIILHNDSAISAMIQKSSTLPGALATYYNEDVSNFTAKEGEKYTAGAKVVAALQRLWSAYAGQSRMAIEQFITLREKSFFGITAEQQQEVNSLKLYLTTLDEIAKQKEAVEALEPPDLTGAGRAGGGGAAKSIKETNEALDEYIKTTEHLKAVGELTAEEEIARYEHALAELAITTDEKAKLEEKLYSLRKKRDDDIYKSRKKLREEDYKNHLDYIKDLETAEGETDYAAQTDAYAAMLAENERLRAEDIIDEEEHLNNRKELLKLFNEANKKLSKETADAIKKDTEEMTAAMIDATDKTVSQIDRLISRQKEMDGLKDESGNLFSFTSEDEIAAIHQQIVAYDALIASLLELVDTGQLTEKEYATYLDAIASKTESLQDRVFSLQIQIQKTAQAAAEQLTALNKKFAEDMAAADAKYAESVAATNSKLTEGLASAHADYVSKIESINKKLAESEQKLTESYEAELDQRAKSLVNFVSIFSEVTQKDVSGQQLLQNLQDQLDTMVNFQKNISELAARGIDEGLLAELEEMGPSAASEIAALNSLTDEELDEYVRIYKEKSALAREIAVDQMAEQRSEMQEQLKQLRADTNEELDQLNADYAEKMAELRENAAEELANHAADWAQTTEDIKVNYAEELANINDLLGESVVKRNGMFKDEQIEQGLQEKQKTKNTKTELERQNSEIERAGAANIATLESFIPGWENVGKQYGNALLSGIQIADVLQLATQTTNTGEMAGGTIITSASIDEDSISKALDAVVLMIKSYEKPLSDAVSDLSLTIYETIDKVMKQAFMQIKSDTEAIFEELISDMNNYIHIIDNLAYEMRAAQSGGEAASASAASFSAASIVPVQVTNTFNISVVEEETSYEIMRIQEREAVMGPLLL